MQDSIVFYGNASSGHVYKVALMLAVGGIQHRYQAIDIDQPRHLRPEPFRSLSRFGEVPLLVHDGQPYVQSDAILYHLAEHTGRFGAESVSRMARVREWLFWEANRLGMCLPQLRYARSFAAPGEFPPGAVAWLQQRFDLDIARLETELSDGRSFILDEQPTIADFSLCGYLFWADDAKVTLPPHVAAWLKRISKLPGWQSPEALLTSPAA
ncbi:glutathione S-transferase, C-terminal domain protein [Collimonas arenae]|uniref:Glutathione S-transferase, C-terminal domain protein n=2 Tax=Collimonas arenae TaxID=279058 RepID=A0A127QPU3_9BURK|nr:glutathione S-transferase, C-terminal domain protein [Collimonas arenae]